ncbi:MAG TPA: aminoglycoside adenylyltransferase domain-containing protein [Pyrinomonadaceae bacterium]|nr:aminoglycoside adenylyltransferase domain-containing protein [Pyrinomonadaceae bacterium]
MKTISDLPENIPENLSELLQAMQNDFPAMLENNLVGIYLWGSLTYAAFDEKCSDVDCIIVTRRDINEREFSEIDEWFAKSLEKNYWSSKLDLRFVIDGEFLDKTSKCCGYHFGRLVRHGSDGNPIIWLNIGQTGITLWGKPAREIAPEVSSEVLNDALLLEIEYLKEDLAANAGDSSDLAFFHNSYAILTACRIFYTAHKSALVSKEIAQAWTLENVPEIWHPVINTARKNRLAGKGTKTAKLETDAMEFVGFIESRVKGLL